MVSIEDLQNEFDNILELQLDDEDEEEKKILGNLQAMCTEFSITAEDIAHKWDAFVYAQRKGNQNKISLDNLQKLRNNLRAEKASKAAKTKLRKKITHPGSLPPKEYNKDTLEMLELSEVFGSGLETKAYGNKRKAESAESAFTSPLPKKFKSSYEDKWLQASPAQGDYKMRANVGKIATSFPATPNIKSESQMQDMPVGRVKVEMVGDAWSDGTEKKGFRYMYEDPDEIRDHLNVRVERILEDISQANGYKKQSQIVKDENTQESGPIKIRKVQYSRLDMPRPDSVYVGGRICKTDEGATKLRQDSVFLEGDRNSDNVRLKLRLGMLKQYSLFPGQVVALKGLNGSGAGMAVEEILPGQPKPHYKPKVKESNHGTIRVLAAAGPFTPADNLTYSPLKDILQKTHNFKPHVLILMGPFIDCKQDYVSQGKVEKTYKDIFSGLMTDIVKHTYAKTKIIITPSPDDMHSAPVFPQPSYNVPKNLPYEVKDRLVFYPNPVTFRVNDVVFGISTSNILFELGKAELSFASGKQQQQPRLKRLVKHLIDQQSYYPLHATKINREKNVGDNIDYTHLYKLSMNPCPDVLILPSKLNYFATNIGDDIVAINPGTLAKGKTGGTYVEVTIHPVQKESDSASKNISTPTITTRTRIDIRKI